MFKFFLYLDMRKKDAIMTPVHFFHGSNQYHSVNIELPGFGDISTDYLKLIGSHLKSQLTFSPLPSDQYWASISTEPGKRDRHLRVVKRKSGGFILEEKDWYSGYWSPIMYV